MLKKIILLIFSFSIVFASEMQKEYLNLFAVHVSSENNVTTATDKVLIFSPTYYITAKKAIYDMNKETLELFGDVNIIRNQQTQSMSEYAFLDIAQESLTQEPAFLMNLSDSLWMSSSSLYADNNETSFEDSTTISSCESDNPFWKIKFSSGFEDKQNHWINTFNTRLYIKSLPIFYTPYFGFSTDKTRRSGLLRPTFGFSNNDGFLFAQPIYLAPESNWDLELVPQFRATRGKGVYGYFRYADSPNSVLNFKTGYFKENDDYALENNLPASHYGYDLEYQKYNMLATKDDQDGIFASLHWLNDIDYKNLENVTQTEDYEKNIESKLNYFYKTDEMFYGSYFRYYLDSSKQSNEETLQLLPTLHAHKFSNSILLDKLLYSVDLKVDNYTREEGAEAQIYNLVAPISYTFSFFDDYLRLSLKESLSYTKLNYQDTAETHENGSVFQNTHIVSLGTDLVKEYEGVLHSVNLDTTLSIPEDQDIKGDIYNEELQQNEDLKEFAISKSGSKQLSIGFNQAFFDSNTTSAIVRHKMTQSANFDENDQLELQNLENEVTIYHSLGSIQNRLIYNNIDKRIIEYSTALDVSRYGVYGKLNHYKTVNTPNSAKSDLETLTLEAGAKLDRFYSVGFKSSYDLFNDLSTKNEYFVNYDKKCWGISLRLEDSIVATSSNSSDAERQKIIYIQLALKPLGGIAQQYKFNSN